jgi:transcriptional regulator
MLLQPWDRGTDDEALDYLRTMGFGHLVAAGTGRAVPVVVPTQFLLTDDHTVLLHLARPNPVWAAIEENPQVLLAVAGDWAYIPSTWTTLDADDPRPGVPTTYYSAVQARCLARVLDDPADKLRVLHQQLAGLEGTAEDIARYTPRLRGIRGLALDITALTAKFKYGGNADPARRAQIARRLTARDGPGDHAATRRIAAQDRGTTHTAD